MEITHLVDELVEAIYQVGESPTTLGGVQLECGPAAWQVTIGKNYPFELPQGTTPLTYDPTHYANAAEAFDALLARAWAQYMGHPPRQAIRDLWDTRITVHCMQCGRLDTGTYSALVREDHWPLTHTGPERQGLCPRCVGTTRHLARYPTGSWYLRP